MRLVILGGSDAGISAALRARELDASLQVTLVVADAFPNYSICGLPFSLSGEVPDWRRLAHRGRDEISQHGIQLLLNHAACAIDPLRHEVTVLDEQRHQSSLVYDRLLIATGATPIRPPLPGLDLPGVFLLHTMSDSFALDTSIRARNAQTAVIIGGGYIGIEMADALTRRGLKVTLVEHHPTVLKTVDSDLGELVAKELKTQGVDVVPSVKIEQITPLGTQLLVQGTPQFSQATDLVLVATCVRPASGLAQACGIECGVHDAIRVSRSMETSMADIYTAGDCVETYHRLLPTPTYLPLGTTAHKQGRVAGENLAGTHRWFAGSLGTQVVKVFDLAIARTGLRDDEARTAGFSPLTVEDVHWDHNRYYPGAQRLHIRMTGDTRTGLLLGTQIVGPWTAEVATRINTVAAALFQHLNVEDLNDVDLSYTPPLGSPWDPLPQSAQTWMHVYHTSTAAQQ